jgi:ABC-type uncharacterized transport system substrate-binding protein
MEFRWAEDKLERLPDLAARLVRSEVDVLMTQGTPAAIAAKNATRTLPIVFVQVGDPVGSGLAAALCTIVTEPAAAPNSSHSQGSVGKPAESSV